MLRESIFTLDALSSGGAAGGTCKSTAYAILASWVVVIWEEHD